MKSLKERLGSEWYEVLNPVFDTTEMRQLATRLNRETNIEPSSPDEWFRAFELVQPSQLKVLVLAQDPYPGGQADGLAFSARNHEAPISLQYIFNELYLEYGVIRRNTDLTDWAKQGVMLLNTVLTTRYRNVLAHDGWGWDALIDEALRHIATLKQPYVVMAWGKYAKAVTRMHLLDAPCILDANHPAAEKHGKVKFTGCGHFRRANEFLVNNNKKPIKWI